jgi:chromate transporter
MIWVFPAFVLMTTCALAYVYFEKLSLPTHFARFLQPMAVGFICFSAWRLIQSLIKDQWQWILLVFAFLSTIFIRSSIVYPVILVLSGWFYHRIHGGKRELPTGRLSPRWGNLFLFFSIFGLAAVFGNLLKLKPVLMFENTFRYGSLVFGGGQVLVPMLFEQFVLHKHYLSAEEFLAGWGIAQAVPGPVFIFTSFTHALALREYGQWGMLLGSFIGAVGIFLPGTLLIFFVFPIWKQLKEWSVVQNGLHGLNAAATGFVLAAAILLGKTISFEITNIIVVVMSFVSLQVLKIPAVLVVVLTLLCGFLLP